MGPAPLPRTTWRSNDIKTTVCLSGEDIISGALERNCSLDLFEDIRKNREQKKRKGKAEKRKSKLAHCKLPACWYVLRTSEKFSGAANTAQDLSVDLDDSLDKDADSSSTSSRGKSRKYEQR